MAFSESLTVRILGDSSGLRRELQSAADEIDKLHSRLSESADASNHLSASFRKLSNATGPLRQLSGLLNRIQQQLNNLAQRPVMLNVQPAISALQQLMRAAQMAATYIRTISTGPSFPTPGPAAPPGSGTMPITGGTPPTRQRQFASGGLVSGPTGIDNIPARLSAGEFVLSRTAVSTLGIGFIDQLNRNPTSLTSQSSSGKPQPLGLDDKAKSGPHSKVLNSTYSEVSRSQSQHNIMNRHSAQHTTTHSQPTYNHFGGITLNVSQANEVDSILRDLRSQGISLRNRRG